MNDSKSVAAHFSKSGAVYARDAVIQKEVAAKLIEFLKLKTVPQQILDLGCGSGFLSRKLAERFPGAALDGIDIAPGMLELAEAEVPQAKFLLGDARSFDYSVCYDLIMSSSAIQWMRPLEQLFLRLGRFLKSEGSLCFAVFCAGTFSELHELRKKIAPHKPPHSALPALEEVRRCLSEAGFRIVDSGECVLTQHYQSAEEFFRAIKQQGFTGGNLSVGHVPLTRRELKRLIEAYNDTFGSLSGVPATYQVQFFKAAKELS